MTEATTLPIPLTHPGAANETHPGLRHVLGTHAWQRWSLDNALGLFV